MAIFLSSRECLAFVFFFLTNQAYFIWEPFGDCQAAENFLDLSLEEMMRALLFELLKAAIAN